MSSSVQPSSTSTAPPAASSSSSGGGGGGGSGSDNQTKPFLFFVALGFGVVFTNLWIIVGVKYCFRYNRRARQALLDQQENGGIDMGSNPPQRRRRREKKLMTMDQVNDKFPLTKYKLWRATREQEGLPAAGGITAPPSRAGSIKDVNHLTRISSEQDRAAADTPSPPQDTKTSNVRDFASVPDEKKSRVSIEVKETATAETPSVAPAATNAAAIEYFHPDRSQTPSTIPPSTEPAADSDADDAIACALPNETLENAPAGDACAICIDPLDDDDEVRGLACGHAFHAACVDPWLTGRRACCPLCKADYYVPKPVEESSESNVVQRPLPVVSLHPRHIFLTGFRSASPANERAAAAAQDQGRARLWPFGPPSRGRVQREARRRTDATRPQEDQTEPAVETAVTAEPEAARPAEQSQTQSSTPAAPRPRMVQRLSSWLPRRNAQSNTPPTSTPAQLEAGTGTGHA